MKCENLPLIGPLRSASLTGVTTEDDDLCGGKARETKLTAAN